MNHSPWFSLENTYPLHSFTRSLSNAPRPASQRIAAREGLSPARQQGHEEEDGGLIDLHEDMRISRGSKKMDHWWL
jgi:hypothetical protein